MIWCRRIIRRSGSRPHRPGLEIALNLEPCATTGRLGKNWTIIVRGVIIAGLLLVVGFGYSIYRTYRRLPEAYAAWDVGMLLVEYLKVHNRQWPRSWDDLFSVTNGRLASSIVFRGARPDEVEYGWTLTNLVAIDWGFDVSTMGRANPVTRKDGTRFPVTWSGAEPNEMVRRYLAPPRSADSTK